MASIGTRCFDLGRALSFRRLTPAMAGILEGVCRVNRPPFHALSVAEARQAYVAATEVLELPRAVLQRVEDFSIPALDGVPLQARLYAASSARLPVLLYLHGGGFTIGNFDTHDSLCRQLALRSGVAVVALEYRLAPEHRFPCAVDDAFSALRCLADQAGSMGMDAGRIAVGGDSAGGTLAAVCAIRARDVGLRLRLQLLITPGTAAEAEFDSHRQFASGFLLESAGIEWFFDHYIDRADRHDWRFAPLLAESLEGVAPACVVLAECDPLVDEGVAFADRLRLAQVPVELEIFRGVTHDFIKMGRVLGEATLAQAMAAQALKKAFSE
jgi:acetyl esterase